MKLDLISSERLSIIRFPLIVGVVFIHTYGTNVTFSGNQSGIENVGLFAQFIQDVLSQGVARLAIPLFFLLSGYFFFLGLEWTVQSYVNQIRKRINSLLIPFLCWNILILMAYTIIQEIPSTANLLSGEKKNILYYNIFDYFNAIFGITKFPIAYQFWFIRDLMVVSLMSPVLVFLIKKAPKIYFVIMFLFWFTEY
jgi:surface polysaccharide O-acyltransferase-like enzyme